MVLSLILLLAAAGTGGAVVVGLSRLLAAFYDSPWQLPGVVARVAWTIGRSLVAILARGGKRRFPEWPLPYEVSMALLHSLSTHYGDRLTTRTNAPILRRQTELLGDFIGRYAHASNATRLESFEFNGLEHVWVRSATPEPEAEEESEPHDEPARHRFVVLYFHGGGYVTLSPRLYQGLASELQSRIRRMLGETLAVSDRSVQVDVLLANYRKAPEFRHPHAPLDALAMYKYLLDEENLSPQQILIMGDSAGAGLALTTMLRLRDEDPALLPVAGILSCPFVDRENEGSEREAPLCLLTDRLVFAFRNAYCHLDGPPSSWGDVSPYHCDLHGLPPVYIQVGDQDYLFGHSQRLYQKAQASGLTSWTLEIFPNMVHEFTLPPPALLPTAAKGLDAMAQYAATQFASTMPAK